MPNFEHTLELEEEANMPKQLLSPTKTPIWDRDYTQIFIGYAFLESIAIALLKNYGVISILFSVLGIAIHPVFIHAWFWAMVVFVVCYLGFKFKLVKRVDYIWDEWTKGHSVLTALQATVDRQTQMIIAGVLLFYLLLIVWLWVVL